jgi:hypothetical protein
VDSRLQLHLAPPLVCCHISFVELLLSVLDVGLLDIWTDKEIGPRVVTVDQAADLIRPKSFPSLDVYCPLASIPYPTLSAVPAVGSSAAAPEETSYSAASSTSPVDSSPLLASAKPLYTSGSSPPRLRSSVPASPCASSATSPRAFCLASAPDPSLVPRYAVLHPNVEYSCWQRTRSLCFPLVAVTHSFLGIAPGDPAFLTADGKQTVVPFAYPAGATPPSTPDKGAYILFSNEASYQVLEVPVGWCPHVSS